MEGGNSSVSANTLGGRSLVKNKEQINECWEVIIADKRTAQGMFWYLSPSNWKIARRLKCESGAALSGEQLVFIRFCMKYMLGFW